MCVNVLASICACNCMFVCSKVASWRLCVFRVFGAVHAYKKTVACEIGVDWLKLLHVYGTCQKSRTFIRRFPQNSFAEACELPRSCPRIARTLSSDRPHSVLGSPVLCLWNLFAVSAERLRCGRETYVCMRQSQRKTYTYDDRKSLSQSSRTK